MVARVRAQRVRQIQLHNGWAEECLRSGTLRIDLATDRHFKVCINQNWHELARAYRARGDSVDAAAKRVEQVRAFFQDDGQTLWITDHAGRMHWTFADPHVEPWIAEHGGGTMRRALTWRSETTGGNPLWTSSLPNKWRKVLSASDIIVELEYGDDIIRRINGRPAQETARIERLLHELREQTAQLLPLTDSADFVHLVELILTSSGWRHQSADDSSRIYELQLPSTGERALLRIIPAATQPDLDNFRANFAGSAYHRLMFVHHTGAVCSTDPRLTVLGPNELARAIVEAGLVSWLINRLR